MNITKEANSTTAFQLEASVMSIIEYYCSYIFITFGTLCNIMAVICLYNKNNTPKDKNNTVRYYLIILAVCDGVFIFWFALMSILLNQRTPINLYWETGCNLAPFCIICSAQLSGLLVTVITLNRFIAVFYPHKFKHLQSIRRIYCCIGILTLTVAIINWHTFGGFKPVDREQLDTVEYFEEQCRGRTSIIDDYNLKVHPFIDFVVYIIIPSIVLFVGNIALAIRLRQLGKKIHPCSYQETPTEARRVTLQEIQASQGSVGRELVENRSSRFSRHLEVNLTASNIKEQPATPSDVSLQPGTSSETNQKPSTSSDASPQPGTSSDASPQPGTSFDTSKQPGTSSDTSSQPGTSYDTSKQPATSSDAIPQPGTSSNTSSQLQPGTSSDAKEQPGASSDTKTRPGTSFEYNSPSGANTNKIHSIPMRHHQASRDIVPLRLGISVVTPVLDGSGSQFTTSSCACTGGSHISHTVSMAPQSHVIKQGKHMTQICIVLSISFLLLASPLVVLRYVILIDMVDVTSATVENLLSVFYLLTCCNHVINFWVYFVCWNEFRRRAVKLFKTLCGYS